MWGFVDGVDCMNFVSIVYCHFWNLLPEFGPVSDTTNADEFLQKVNKLRANGGGDEPEMSLSALQV